VGDGEDADAALGTAGVADEVCASALVGVGYGCVYDLDKGVWHSQRSVRNDVRVTRTLPSRDR